MTETTIFLCALLLLSACDDDISLSRKDWQCTAATPYQVRVCVRGALDLKMGREGECHIEDREECTQWTKQ